MVSDVVIAANYVVIAEARTAMTGKWCPLPYSCANSVEECRHLMKVHRDKWHELKEKGVFDAFRVMEYGRQGEAK